MSQQRPVLNTRILEEKRPNMYLGSALKIAIPFAHLDRLDLARSYGYEGPVAEEAERACAELKALEGVKVSAFTAAQRETARLALCWAEQYLYGYIDALTESDAEAKSMKKLMAQLRKVRLEHFGYTENETAIARSVALPIGGAEADKNLCKLLRSVSVVCPSCKTSTNMYSPGDSCSSCNEGIFQAQ